MHEFLNIKNFLFMDKKVLCRQNYRRYINNDWRNSQLDAHQDEFRNSQITRHWNHELTNLGDFQFLPIIFFTRINIFPILSFVLRWSRLLVNIFKGILMYQIIDCTLNWGNLWRFNNVEKNIINVLENLAFRGRLQLFRFEDWHLQTNTLDLRDIKLIQILQLFFSYHSINYIIRNSSNSAFSLYEVW